MFFVSNIVNIHLYNFLKKKFPKQLWLRNNVATILCNCLENYLFVGLAFAFIFPVTTILSIATVKTVLEIIISICSTPFLYVATKSFKKNKDDKRRKSKEKKMKVNKELMRTIKFTLFSISAGIIEIVLFELLDHFTSWSLLA